MNSKGYNLFVGVFIFEDFEKQFIVQFLIVFELRITYKVLGWC